MNKDKSWPHAVIALIVMAVFYYIVPPLPVVIYAALLPVIYYFGREVRDAEHYLGLTTLSFFAPLVPWLWPNKDNRMDFYAPAAAVCIFGLSLTFWKIELLF